MGIAGVAYDGSVWVTAASSVALVVASGGFVAGGAWLLARRVSEGGLNLGGMDVGDSVTRSGRRVQPLQKSSSDSEQQGSVQPPPRAESVDEIQ